ncbi:MAG: hypothetical protein E7542_00860 [Ruminococcaceae bacterium]|nr:hypothetical protein [Oscillospiraceae bacterium]
MYNNISGKIKSLAKFLFGLFAMLGIASGLVLLFIGLTESVNDFIISGIITIIVVPIIAWISTWLLYGFGELIEKTCIIAENTENLRYISPEFFKKTDRRYIKELEELQSKLIMK